MLECLQGVDDVPTRNEAYSRCDRGTDRLTSEKVAVDITVSLALAASSLAIWFYLVAVRGRFWHGLERDDLDPVSASASWPPVTAVVPARNEADSIAASLCSLLQQDYPGLFSVILVDDQSGDGTAAIAAEAALGADRPLTIVRGRPLPGAEV